METTKFERPTTTTFWANALGEGTIKEIVRDATGRNDVIEVTIEENYGQVTDEELEFVVEMDYLGL